MNGTDTKRGPLAGRRVIELAGIGPGPYCGQLLADLGAEVIAISRPGAGAERVDARGKKSVVLDLKQAESKDAILRLVERSDVLIEGYRPGVAERLGLGPEDCHARNPKLVYGRMTGWGQTGPLAHTAGHDINYISITGALHAIGPENAPPPPPLNLIGDFGAGSLFLAMGVLAGVISADKTGQGDVVDAAIVDGTHSLMGIFHSLDHEGIWSPKRASNVLDGAAPYYRCYETADGKFMAVGAIEPQFFVELLSGLQIPPETFGDRDDPVQWPRQNKLLEETFRQRNRDEWSGIFFGTDACVSPVLDYREAQQHPHNIARHALTQRNGLTHPHASPRFANNPLSEAPTTAPPGSDTKDVLKWLRDLN